MAKNNCGHSIFQTSDSVSHISARSESGMDTSKSEIFSLDNKSPLKKPLADSSLAVDLGCSDGSLSTYDSDFLLMSYQLIL